jgi:hypothetical protein
MKLEQPLQLVVSVRQSGGTHAARILGEGISASCTMGNEEAVEVAVKKFVQRNRVERPEWTIKCVADSVSASTWLVTLSTKNPQPSTT